MNYAVSQESTPLVELVIATETACRNLPAGKAADLRVKIRNILTNDQPNKVKHSNISKEER